MALDLFWFNHQTFLSFESNSKMNSSVIILQPEQDSITSSSSRNITRSKIGLFSLILLCTLLFGIYGWYTSLQIYLSQHQTTKTTHYELSRMIQLDNTNSFEETILKYKVWRIFTCGYAEPNIILSLCILLTFGFTINTLETQTATSIAFYEYNGNNIYLQIFRLGLDGVQYLLAGRCYCLNSGAGAVWLNLLTKIAFNRGAPTLAKKPFAAIAVAVTYMVAGYLLVYRGRLDLLLGVLIALVEVIMMKGGSIKYPKSMYQQKQGLAQCLKITKLSMWHPFVWNDYRQNHVMTLDNNQFYVDQEVRLQNNQLQTQQEIIHD